MTQRMSGDGSRVEAAEAGIHAEVAEDGSRAQPDEHVTATDVATEPPPSPGSDAHPHAPRHHHPPDPNAGVVRGRVSGGAMLAAAVTAAVTILAIVLLAVKIGAA